MKNHGNSQVHATRHLFRLMRRLAGGLILSALVGLSLVSLADTIIVDNTDGTPDLQTALDGAVPGDRVLVLPGTYYGRFVLPRDVDLIGSGAEVTVLDGEGLGTTLTVECCAPLHNLVRGFTITGGSDSGIHFDFARGVIEENIIEGNSGIWGGGVSLRGCPVTLRNNVVRNNTATGSGGGVYVRAACRGIWSGGQWAVQITNNIIHGNSADSGGGVGVFRSYHLHDLPAVTHNTIAGNSAVNSGGVYVENYFDDSGWPDTASGRITNNVIAGNSGGGLLMTCEYYGACSYPTAYPEVENNLVFDNGPFEISGGMAGVGDAGNISADPQFMDPGAGDYRLSPASPALDTGAVLSTFPVTEDKIHFPRPVDGNLDGAPLPDMGAFEETGEVSGLAIGADMAGLSWNPRNGALAFHLYRGDLPTLLSGGSYTQDPLSVPEARQWCDLSMTSFSDADTPALGSAYFYLVTPVDLVEGSLGYDGARQPRPSAHPCP